MPLSPMILVSGILNIRPITLMMMLETDRINTPDKNIFFAFFAILKDHAFLNFAGSRALCHLAGNLQAACVNPKTRGT